MAEHPKEVLVYMVRHGTTELNEQNCFRGPLDPDLDGAGWRDAHALAYYFEPIDMSAIVYSPKKRARHTAELIKREREIPFFSNLGLQALDVGHLAGQKRTPETEAEIQYHCDNPDIPIKGGESLNCFRDRVRPLIQNGVQLAMEYGKPVVIVAHSSLVHETGEMFNGDHSSTLVKPGGVAAVYIVDGELKAEPIFKPDFARIGESRATIIT
jgi:broad specificity phosphatase PhoE